jgi:hypothetical protein
MDADLKSIAAQRRREAELQPLTGRAKLVADDQTKAGV